MKKISIVIPAHNEERRIGATLKAYTNFFNKIEKARVMSYEIVVVINGSKDRTLEVVQSHKNKNMRVLNFKQSGKGFAVIEGFKDALKRDNEMIGFVDADMATSPEEYWKLIESVGSYDGAIANRYLKDSVIMPKPTLARLFAKRLFNFVARSLLLLPYTDTQCGAKIFKREVLARIIPKLSMSQWAFDVEMLYMAKKCKYMIISVPTRWSDKAYSTINFWKAGPGMALGVVRLRIIHSPFKGLMEIYHWLLKANKSL